MLSLSSRVPYLPATGQAVFKTSRQWGYDGHNAEAHWTPAWLSQDTDGISTLSYITLRIIQVNFP